MMAQDSQAGLVNGNTSAGRPNSTRQVVPPLPLSVDRSNRRRTSVAQVYVHVSTWAIDTFGGMQNVD